MLSLEPADEVMGSYELERTRVGLESKQGNFDEKRAVMKDDSVLLKDVDDTEMNLNGRTSYEYDNRPTRLMDLYKDKRNTQPSQRTADTKPDKPKAQPPVIANEGLSYKQKEREKKRENPLSARKKFGEVEYSELERRERQQQHYFDKTPPKDARGRNQSGALNSGPRNKSLPSEIERVDM